MIRYEKKTLLMAALMGGCSLQGMAQQIIPRMWQVTRNITGYAGNMS